MGIGIYRDSSHQTLPYLQWLPPKIKNFGETRLYQHPITSIPLIAYCILPAFCFITDRFIIPEISKYVSVWFILLFISIDVTGILELKWSGVSIEHWWRNEQFWVIRGTSAHLFAVFQDLLIYSRYLQVLWLVSLML